MSEPAHAVLRPACGRRRPASSTSPDGRCRCSTPTASSPNTWPRAAAPGSSTCRTWAASCCAAADAVPFLQHVLTNNAAALDVLQAQYTIMPRHGGAVDDAYLYRFLESEYLLVVNASNRVKDWEHFHPHVERFPDVGAHGRDRRDRHARAAGPEPRATSWPALSRPGACPSPCATSSRIVTRRRRAGVAWAAPGYTGEPVCFELFVAAAAGAGSLWDALVAAGAVARRTRRPRHAAPRGRPAAVRAGARRWTRRRRDPVLSSRCHLRGELLAAQGRVRRPRRAGRQQAACVRIARRDYSLAADLPRLMRPVAMHRARHRPRRGAGVQSGKQVGWVTSGTAVPYWGWRARACIPRRPTSADCAPSPWPTSTADIVEDDELDRRRPRPASVPALVVPYHLRSDAPPLARPIVCDRSAPAKRARLAGGRRQKATQLIGGDRQPRSGASSECINLIPSEMTASPHGAAALGDGPGLPVCRAQEGRGFLRGGGLLLPGDGLHRARWSGCWRTRCAPISAAPKSNAAWSAARWPTRRVFSAMVDYINRADRKAEPRRIRQGDEQPHRQGRPSQRPAHGRAAGFRRARSAHRVPGRGEFPGARRQPLQASTSPATLELIERHAARS